MVKEVLVLFKTHLDIGYSDYAGVIVDRYINSFIPKAIKLGYELKDSDSPFIWTVGSWLIDKALKTDDGSLEKAIEDGIIVWHALPFTTHTEIMSKELFEYGLSISKKLDERFGKKPCRLPQSFWCKPLGFDENWEIEKLGKWINPEEIISSKLICGFDRGVRNKEYEIHSPDAALCAPFGRNLLRYGIETEKQDMYFNLYNNIWNTNFPMWYEDDSVFRFEIRKR